MHKPTDLINQNQTGQMKQSEPHSNEYNHREDKFIETWRKLQAGKFIIKDEVVDGTDYRFWRHNLKDLTDKQLDFGVKGTSFFHGYLTWAAFRKLCIDYSRIERDRITRERSYGARISLPETLGDKRFQELNKVTQAMSAEEGSGPIHKATLDGTLTARFVEGKSAEEIIKLCHNLYG